jgi:hypothetical protein
MNYNQGTIAEDLKAIQNSAAGRLLSKFISGLKQPAMVEMTPAQKMLYERRFGKPPEPITQEPETAKNPVLSTSVVNAFNTQYDMSDPAQVAALQREMDEDRRRQGNPQFADLRGGSGISPTPTPEPTPTPTPTPTEPGPKLDPNATESFKTAFNAGNNNMDQIQAMYADGPKYKDTGKTALQIWAENTPALAQKEYLKKAFNADGTPKILDKTAEGFDKPDAPGVVESINGSTLQNPIPINTLNEVLDKSEEAENTQEFLKNFIATGQYLT